MNAADTRARCLRRAKLWFVLTWAPAAVVLLLMLAGHWVAASLLFTAGFVTITVGTLMPRCEWFGRLTTRQPHGTMQPLITIDDGPPVITVPGSYNKLGNRRFLRFTSPGPRPIEIRVTCELSDPTCVGTPQPDPDFVLSRAFQTEFAGTATPFTERLQTNVEAGDYVLEVYDYSHVDPAAVIRRGRTCMIVNITG